jgi:pilus assembly protein CpaE
MGYDVGKVRVVLNRADSRVGLSGEDVETIVGREPDVLVPSHRDVTRSLNEATPIASSAPRSEAAKAFQRLAGLYQTVGQPTGSETATARRGLLRRKK